MHTQTHTLTRALESKVMTTQASAWSHGAIRVSGVSDWEPHSLMEVLKVGVVAVTAVGRVCVCAYAGQGYIIPPLAS